MKNAFCSRPSNREAMPCTTVEAPRFHIPSEIARHPLKTRTFLLEEKACYSTTTPRPAPFKEAS